MTAISSYGKGSVDRDGRESSRLTRGPLVSFVLLPTIVVLGIGIVVGPPLWRMWYPPVREFCVAHFARLDPGHMAWKVMLLLVLVSLAALVLNLTRDLVLSARLKRTIARHGVTTPQNLKQLQQRHRLRTPVVCTEEEGLYAFCYGLRRPAIVISSGLNQALSEAELEAVILHEAAHAKSRDPRKILISRLLARALFYIPPLGTLQERYALYTNCTAFCPTVLSPRMQELQGRLRDEGLAGQEVVLLSFSVDPEQDPPDKLRAYAENYGADPEVWRFLTGSGADMERVVTMGLKLGVQKILQPVEHTHPDGSAHIHGYKEWTIITDATAAKIRRLRQANRPGTGPGSAAGPARRKFQFHRRPARRRTRPHR